MSKEEPSNETLHAILIRVEENVEKIKIQTTETNGRVNILEKDLARKDGAIGIIIGILVVLAIPIILMLIDTYLIK